MSVLRIQFEEVMGAHVNGHTCVIDHVGGDENAATTFTSSHDTQMSNIPSFPPDDILQRWGGFLIFPKSSCIHRH